MAMCVSAYIEASAIVLALDLFLLFNSTNSSITCEKIIPAGTIKVFDIFAAWQSCTHCVLRKCEFFREIACLVLAVEIVSFGHSWKRKEGK